MPITLLEAAKLCGLDKSTLRKAVRDGRISGTRDDRGVWWVEPCEVERIYPLVPAADPQSVPRSPTGTDTADIGRSAGDIHADLLVKELRQVIADLRADRERDRNDKDKAIADLRADRDHWRGIAERLSLPAPRSSPPPAPSSGMAPVHSAPPVKRPGWWRWMVRATG